MSTNSPERTPTPPTPSARPFGVPERTPPLRWPILGTLVPERIVAPAPVPAPVPVPPLNGGGKTPPGKVKP